MGKVCGKMTVNAAVVRRRRDRRHDNRCETADQITARMERAMKETVAQMEGNPQMARDFLSRLSAYDENGNLKEG